MPGGMNSVMRDSLRAGVVERQISGSLGGQLHPQRLRIPGRRPAESRCRSSTGARSLPLPACAESFCVGIGLSPSSSVAVNGKFLHAVLLDRDRHRRAVRRARDHEHAGVAAQAHARGQLGIKAHLDLQQCGIRGGTGGCRQCRQSCFLARGIDLRAQRGGRLRVDLREQRFPGLRRFRGLAAWRCAMPRNQRARWCCGCTSQGMSGAGDRLRIEMRCGAARARASAASTRTSGSSGASFAARA